MFVIKNVKYKNILNIENLVLHDKKVTCIIGESGAGKSTFLKLLNKILSFDSGTITFNEESLSDIDSIQLRRKVVMLPQQISIFSGSVRDNLIIGLKFSEKEIVSNDILLKTLEFINLKKELDDDASKLSGGEKQRLALGRVILLDAEVFLLDEPSSALDEDTAHLIIEKLVQYTKENNKTLIMVTHSKSIANEYADQIIEFYKGKVK